MAHQAKDRTFSGSSVVKSNKNIYGMQCGAGVCIQDPTFTASGEVELDYL